MAVSEKEGGVGGTADSPTMAELRPEGRKKEKLQRYQPERPVEEQASTRPLGIFWGREFVGKKSRGGGDAGGNPFKKMIPDQKPPAQRSRGER